MNIQRGRHTRHNFKPVHRAIYPKGTMYWLVDGHTVMLSQLEPKGLWRLSSTASSDHDAEFDAKYPERSLRAWLTWLRLMA